MQSGTWIDAESHFKQKQPNQPVNLTETSKQCSEQDEFYIWEDFGCCVGGGQQQHNSVMEITVTLKSSVKASGLLTSMSGLGQSADTGG